mgnify:CR=1 FL=1
MIESKKITRFIFIVVAACCLSQGSFFIMQKSKYITKIEATKSGARPHKNKMIDNLFMNFLLK